MERKEVKKKVEELQKATDDWRNNQFTAFKFQTLSNVQPKMFSEFRRDKHKDPDAGQRMLGRNKRKRRRDVIEHPENL